MSDKDSTVTGLGDSIAKDTAAAASAAASAKATKASAKAASGELDQNLIKKGFSGKRVTITMPPARDDNDQDFVFAALNGEAFQIPRGKPVDVPEELVALLEDAVETRFNSKDGLPRQVQRHTFSVAR